MFDNFYTDSALTRPLRSFKLTENTNLYVRFDLKYSNVYFCLGYDNDSKIIVSVGYNQPIYYPNNISRANFTFIGWYADKDLSTVFVSGIPMATEDVYVYAKWQEKQHIQIDTTSQTFSVDNLNMSFSNFSELTGFVVEYFVNGKWNTWVPASVGSYDVRITRAEDTNYASFEMILQNALIVEPQYVNITWVIAILLIVFLIEIMVCVLLKVMKKLKTNLSLSLVLLPLMSMFFDGSSGNLFINDRQAIPLVQFILLIVSAALAIAGFVFMIIFIYRLHRTAPALLFDNVPNNDLNNGFDENARQAPKDNSDDLKIKNKIDDYLSGFVTDQHGYVSQNDSETALSQVAGEENESPAEEIYNDERGGDSPSAPEENADHADE